VADAQALLRARRYAAAYHLSGFIVECALKACIAKRMRAKALPPPVDVVKGIYSHNLRGLLKEAGITRPTKGSKLEANWGIVIGWDVASRYRNVSAPEARDLFKAITDTNDGVLEKQGAPRRVGARLTKSLG
jgi:hypothetical protein